MQCQPPTPASLMLKPASSQPWLPSALSRFSSKHLDSTLYSQVWGAVALEPLPIPAANNPASKTAALTNAANFGRPSLFIGRLLNTVGLVQGADKAHHVVLSLRGQLAKECQQLILNCRRLLG